MSVSESASSPSEACVKSMSHITFTKSIPLDILDTGFSHLKFFFWINKSNIVNRFIQEIYAVFSVNQLKFHDDIYQLFEYFVEYFAYSLQREEFFLRNKKQI